MSDPVKLEIRDRVGYLTLNRPDAMNGIDEGVLEGLASALTEIEGSEDLKALVVTGAGDAFCVGLDIELLGRAFDDLDYFRDVLERLRGVLLRLERLPVPVIAAVNGLARAGGFEIVLSSDLVIVAEEARLADHHMTFGIPPGGGASQRAPRKLGDQRAREILFTGRWVKGHEAVEMGLAMRSVPRTELDQAVESLAATFREKSRPALAATKAMMSEGAGLPLERALELETEHFLRYLAEEPTSREGYLAYVEGREPVWP